MASPRGHRSCASARPTAGRCSPLGLRQRWGSACSEAAGKCLLPRGEGSQDWGTLEPEPSQNPLPADPPVKGLGAAGPLGAPHGACPGSVSAAGEPVCLVGWHPGPPAQCNSRSFPVRSLAKNTKCSFHLKENVFVCLSWKLLTLSPVFLPRLLPDQE